MPTLQNRRNRCKTAHRIIPAHYLQRVYPSRLWPFIRPYQGRVILAAVIWLHLFYFALAWARAGWLVDKGLGSGDPVMLDKAVMVALFLALFVGVGSYLRILLVNQVAERVMADIRAAIYGHVLYLPTGWFEAARTGDTLAPECRYRCCTDHPCYHCPWRYEM